jgi:hypothetical protein
MRSLMLLIVMSFFFSYTHSQTVSEVLHNGVPVKKNDKILFFLDGNVFKSVVSPSGSSFLPYEDSTIFLLHANGVNVMLPPLNPLKYSYDTATSTIPDPILNDVDNAFASVSTLLNRLKPTAGPGTPKVTCNCSCDISSVAIEVNKITPLLADDYKSRINKVFTSLRDLPFDNQVQTQNAIGGAKDSIDIFIKHYNEIDSEIIELKKSVNNFNCDKDEFIIDNYVITQILNQIQTSFNAKQKRLSNLIKAYDLVKSVADKAASPNPTGMVWYHQPVSISLTDRKIKLLAITVNYSGMELADDEIVQTQKKQYFTKVLRFRRFDRFVPEVSAGIVYTDLTFPKYGTATDNNGQTIVADAGEEKFKKMNITGMVNWNYYIENSSFNPFFQIGIGANADYPVLLAGIGGRFNTGVRKFAFSVGAASSWIKTLDKLKIGDKVSGTADIEKDYKFDFKKPKIYFGIQYNF